MEQKVTVIAELFHLHTDRYNVVFDGDLIVEGSRDPECDLARALKARGHCGMVNMLDGATKRLRSIINIEKASRLKVEEGPSGPRFVKYRPQTVVGRSYAGDLNETKELWRSLA
jgi:hypothetical protein